MKVVLLKNVVNLGIKGDIKDVKAGYAQNFLFPQGLATTATSARAQAAIASKEKQTTISDSEKQTLVQTIQNIQFIFELPVNEQGTLYAAVDKSVVQATIKQEHVQAFVVKMEPAHIKTVGTHKVELTISHGLIVQVSIVVVPEKK